MEEKEIFVALMRAQTRARKTEQELTNFDTQIKHILHEGISRALNDIQVARLELIQLETKARHGGNDSSTSSQNSYSIKKATTSAVQMGEIEKQRQRLKVAQAKLTTVAHLATPLLLAKLKPSLSISSSPSHSQCSTPSLSVSVSPSLRPLLAPPSHRITPTLHRGQPHPQQRHSKKFSSSRSFDQLEKSMMLPLALSSSSSTTTTTSSSLSSSSSLSASSSLNSFRLPQSRHALQNEENDTASAKDSSAGTIPKKKKKDSAHDSDVHTVNGGEHTALPNKNASSIAEVGGDHHRGITPPANNNAVDTTASMAVLPPTNNLESSTSSSVSDSMMSFSFASSFVSAFSASVSPASSATLPPSRNNKVETSHRGGGHPTERRTQRSTRTHGDVQRDGEYGKSRGGGDGGDGNMKAGCRSRDGGDVSNDDERKLGGSLYMINSTDIKELMQQQSDNAMAAASSTHANTQMIAQLEGEKNGSGGGNRGTVTGNSSEAALAPRNGRTNTDKSNAGELHSDGFDHCASGHCRVSDEGFTESEYRINSEEEEESTSFHTPLRLEVHLTETLLQLRSSLGLNPSSTSSISSSLSSSQSSASASASSSSSSSNDRPNSCSSSTSSFASESAPASSSTTALSSLSSPSLSVQSVPTLVSKASASNALVTASRAASTARATATATVTATATTTTTAATPAATALESAAALSHLSQDELMQGCVLLYHAYCDASERVNDLEEQQFHLAFVNTQTQTQTETQTQTQLRQQDHHQSNQRQFFSPSDASSLASSISESIDDITGSGGDAANRHVGNATNTFVDDKMHTRHPRSASNKTATKSHIQQSRVHRRAKSGDFNPTSSISGVCGKATASAKTSTKRKAETNANASVNANAGVNVNAKSLPLHVQLQRLHALYKVACRRLQQSYQTMQRLDRRWLTSQGKLSYAKECLFKCRQRCTYYRQLLEQHCIQYQYRQSGKGDTAAKINASVTTSANMNMNSSQHPHQTQFHNPQQYQHQQQHQQKSLLHLRKSISLRTLSSVSSCAYPPRLSRELREKNLRMYSSSNANIGVTFKSISKKSKSESKRTSKNKNKKHDASGTGRSDTSKNDDQRTADQPESKRRTKLEDSTENANKLRDEEAVTKKKTTRERRAHSGSLHDHSTHARLARNGYRDNYNVDDDPNDEDSFIYLGAQTPGSAPVELQRESVAETRNLALGYAPHRQQQRPEDRQRQAKYSEKRQQQEQQLERQQLEQPEAVEIEGEEVSAEEAEKISGHQHDATLPFHTWNVNWKKVVSVFNLTLNSLLFLYVVWKVTKRVHSMVRRLGIRLRTGFVVNVWY